MKAYLTGDGKFTLEQKNGHTDAASVIKSCKTHNVTLSNDFRSFDITQKQICLLGLQIK